MLKKNYKMVVQHGGTRYDGWQRQGGTEDTIQSKLESVTKEMTGENVKIIDSGRTDIGVHAISQVADMYMDTKKTPQEIKDYVNQYPPDGIVVIQLEKAPDRFHSRLDTMGKVYTYWIETAPKCSVFQRKYIYILEWKLGAEAMRQAMKLLCGAHDFKSFCSNKNMKRSTVRAVKTISIQERGSGLEIHVIGGGFLYSMVRALVGTPVEAGLGKRTPDSMREILEAKDRRVAEAMAPACGLFLTIVMYDN